MASQEPSQDISSDLLVHLMIDPPSPKNKMQDPRVSCGPSITTSAGQLHLASMGPSPGHRLILPHYMLEFKQDFSCQLNAFTVHMLHSHEVALGKEWRLLGRKGAEGKR
jgi:hypothetical protein